MEKALSAAQGQQNIRLAGMLARLENYKKQVDSVKAASLMMKVGHAENALNAAAVLFTDQVLLIHEFKGQIARLESRLLTLECKK